MHIQPTNQSYANQNQTIASNVAVPYSIAIQATHDSAVMQQATSQMNSVNQSNLQYVNSTIPTQQTQPTAMVQQPILVQPIQAQQTVVTNPNRNNVISSETGEHNSASMSVIFLFKYLFPSVSFNHNDNVQSKIYIKLNDKSNLFQETLHKI